MRHLLPSDHSSAPEVRTDTAARHLVGASHLLVLLPHLVTLFLLLASPTPSAFVAFTSSSCLIVYHLRCYQDCFHERSISQAVSW